MKHSIYMVGLVAVVSFLSGSVQADGVTIVQLSSMPIIKAHIIKTHHVTSRRVSERLRHKGRTIKTRSLRKNRVDVRKRVRNLRVKPLVKYHYIKSGDSLYKIAKRYKVTVKHIMNVNHLKSSVIKIGGRLKI